MNASMSIAGVVVVTLLVNLPVTAEIIYVDDSATGPDHDGASWCSAYDFLQDALAVAEAGDMIFVAEGIYQPDQGSNQTLGDRAATFELIDEVILKGGYAGCGKPDPSANDPEVFETVLSGDLTGDDGPDFLNYSENSLHVVTGASLTGATIDGFKVTGGNADQEGNEQGAGMRISGSGVEIRRCMIIANRASALDPKFSEPQGGGALVGGDVFLDSCSFFDNEAFGETFLGARGGGLVAWGDSTVVMNSHFKGNTVRSPQGFVFGGGFVAGATIVEIRDCEFLGNRALGEDGRAFGGALWTPEEQVTIEDCNFSGNHAAATDGWTLGGAYFISADGPTVVRNCSFHANEVTSLGRSFGGAVAVGNPARFVNCEFLGNLSSAGSRGFAGAAWLSEPNTEFSHCRFLGNVAVSPSLAFGGAIGADAATTAVNCLFSGNIADGANDAFGGAVYVSQIADLPSDYRSCTFANNMADPSGSVISQGSDGWTTMTNSIVWSNLVGSTQLAGGAFEVNHSLVENGWPGDGNIGGPPMFLNAFGADGQPGTDDDNLRLTSGSPAIDAGDNEQVPADIDDLDGDADTSEVLPFDLDLLERFIDDPGTRDTGMGTPPVVDMGAYEFGNIVTAIGSRYVQVTPGLFGPGPVSIRIASPFFDCLDVRYVAANGTIVEDPVFHEADDWGTVAVHDADIWPETPLVVEFFDGVDVFGPLHATTWVWGDADNNTAVNFADVQLIVFGFQGEFSYAADLEPCMPNGFINFADIQQGVFAFQGGGFADLSCPAPCLPQ